MSEDRYKHLTGGNGEQLTNNHLRVQNQAQAQEIQRLANEIAARAMPTLANLTDAIMTTAAMARSGSPVHREQLRLLFAALDQAQEVLNVASKILVPKH